MKKVILLLTIVALATSSTRAQDEGVRLGIKAAPSWMWLKSDTKGIENDGNKVGFTFGLISEFPIGAEGKYRFGTGLFMQYAGGKYKQEFTYTDVNGTSLTKELKSAMNLQYLELPLTIKLMTNEIGYSRYFGLIGFGTAFNLSAKGDYETAAVDSNGQVAGFSTFEDEDIKDSIQSFRAGLIVGAGMEYNFSGSTTVQFGLTYNNGFTNLIKDVKVGDQTAKLLQNYLELNLALFF